MSSFASKPEDIGPDHLDGLLKHALSIIPSSAVPETPIFLLATAGMRMLGPSEQTGILDNVCSYFQANSRFLLPDCGLHIQVISGETEGLYGWVATNYLLGSFDSPGDHEHGKGHHTYGFLDMGGASAQIAFAPNATEAEKHANDLKLLRLRNVDGSSQEYQVFVTSWLEFGVREARKRYVKHLEDASAAPGILELPDPCLPAGLRTTLVGELSTSQSNMTVLGTGKFDECLRQTYPLLDKDAPCADEPCLLHGVHVPTIDFNVNHFIGISEYWHTTHEIFEMGHKDKAYDFNTYHQRVQAFCSEDWTNIEVGLNAHQWGKKVDREKAAEVCFKASWIINMLHSGIGVPRVGLENTKWSGHNGTKEAFEHGTEKNFLDPFQAVNKIHDTEVSWTLGKVVLYAASEIPTSSAEILPVGFGSNVPGIPGDFQYPSVLGPGLNGSSNVEDEHWHDTLFMGDSPRRTPGLLLFVLIIIIALFFLCGRTRRQRIYHTLRNWSKRGSHSHSRRRFLGGKLPFISRNSPAYERVMEEGGLEFELGGVDSDSSESESDHSQGSMSASPRHMKRPSSRGTGGGTPTLKFDLDNSSNGSLFHGIASSSDNVLDRSGLVVRTESREYLAPLSVSPTNNGRRSRNASPTRTHFKPTNPTLFDID